MAEHDVDAQRRLPLESPPANYYKPSSIASTFGYQGIIGP